MSGYETRVLKDLAIVVPVGTRVDQNNEWITLFEWKRADLPDGASVLEFELAGELGVKRPTDIQTRLLRPGQDVTKREAQIVGTIKSWAVVLTYLEHLGDADFPLALQAWQKAGGLTIVKVVAKCLNPAVYTAERIL